jgi:chromosome segregation ATPase
MMQKIQPALERLLSAVDKLNAEHARLSADGQTMLGKMAELDALQIECAHLRTDISTLKKQNQNLEGTQKRAASQVEKAMQQIDDVLGEA